jgi:general stress protein 26
MTLLVLEGRMYMLTSRNSPKIEQIVRDPVCQIYTDLSSGENSGFVRMSCRAVIVEDQPERDRLFSTVASAGSFWESSADPDFCLLRLDPFAGDLIAPGEMWKRKISMVT